MFALGALILGGYAIFAGDNVALGIAAALAALGFRRTVIRFNKAGALANLVILVACGVGFFFSGGDDKAATPTKTATAAVKAPRATPPVKKLSPAEKVARRLKADKAKRLSSINGMIRDFKTDAGNIPETTAKFEKRARALAREPAKTAIAKLAALEKEMATYGAEVAERRQVIEKQQRYYRYLARACTSPKYYARRTIQARGHDVVFCRDSEPVWFPTTSFAVTKDGVLIFTLV